MTYKKTDWVNRVYDDDGNILVDGTPLMAKDMDRMDSMIEELANNRGKAKGTATLDKEGIVKSSQLPSNLKEIRIAKDLVERDSYDKFEGLRVLVTDASADETVNVGWAEYVWDGIEFIKVAEAESLDVVLNWDNLEDKPSKFEPVEHTHAEKDITDLDKYSKEEVDIKVDGKSDTNHTHTEFNTVSRNKARIEELEVLGEDSHTHNNKTNLDKVRYSGNKPTVDLIKLEELENRAVDYDTDIVNKPTIPNRVSELENDENYVKGNVPNITVSTTAPSNPKQNDIWIVV